MAAHSAGGPVQRGGTRAAAEWWCARPILQSPESKKAWGANKKVGCSQAEACRGLGWPKIVGGTPENWEAHGLKALGGENKSEGSPEPVGGSQGKPQAKEAPKKEEAELESKGAGCEDELPTRCGPRAPGTPRRAGCPESPSLRAGKPRARRPIPRGGKPSKREALASVGACAYIFIPTRTYRHAYWVHVSTHTAVAWTEENTTTGKAEKGNFFGCSA